MDQHVILRGRRQPFTIRNKIFQFFRPDAATQGTPGIVAKRHNGPKMGVRKFDFEGRQFIGKCSAGRAQGVQVAFYIGFNPNCRTAMFRQNATLNLRHDSS